MNTEQARTAVEFADHLVSVHQMRPKDLVLLNSTAIEVISELANHLREALKEIDRNENELCVAKDQLHVDQEDQPLPQGIMQLRDALHAANDRIAALQREAEGVRRAYEG